MSAATTGILFEKFTCRPVPVLSLVDRFAQMRGTRGPLPPPIGALRFSLVARVVAAGPAPFASPLKINVTSNATGFSLLSNEVSEQGDPAKTLAPGMYRVHIDSDYYQPADVDVTWPPDPANVPSLNLLPSSAYPFPDLTVQPQGTGLTLVRGGLFAPDGTPQAGVAVSITAPATAQNWPFNRCVTAVTGDWVLVIPDPQTFPPPAGGPPPAALAITLHFELPTGAVDVANVQVNLGSENSVLQSGMRGRVISDKGVPIPRSVITVAGKAGNVTTRVDGQWFFYFDLQQNNAQVRVTATAPNGRGQDQVANVRRFAVVVLPAFQIPMN